MSLYADLWDNDYGSPGHVESLGQAAGLVAQWENPGGIVQFGLTVRRPGATAYLGYSEWEGKRLIVHDHFCDRPVLDGTIIEAALLNGRVQLLAAGPWWRLFDDYEKNNPGAVNSDAFIKTALTNHAAIVSSDQSNICATTVSVNGFTLPVQGMHPGRIIEEMLMAGDGSGNPLMFWLQPALFDRNGKPQKPVAYMEALSTSASVDWQVWAREKVAGSGVLAKDVGDLATSVTAVYQDPNKVYDYERGALSYNDVVDDEQGTLSYDGTELVTNGDMELDANWANYGTPTTNVRSNAQAHGGTYSRKFTADAANEGIQGDTFATVTNDKNQVSLWVYPDDATRCRIKIRQGDNSGWVYDAAKTSLTQDAWNEITINYTETAGGSGAYIVIESDTQTSGDWYVDDVSILKPVLFVDSGQDFSDWETGSGSAVYRIVIQNDDATETRGYLGSTGVTNDIVEVYEEASLTTPGFAGTNPSNKTPVSYIVYRVDPDEFTDGGQDFSDWETVYGWAKYQIRIQNEDGSETTGYLGQDSGGTMVYVWKDQAMSSSGFNSANPGGKAPVSYSVLKVDQAEETAAATNNMAKYWTRKRAVSARGLPTAAAAAEVRDVELAQLSNPQIRREFALGAREIMDGNGGRWPLWRLLISGGYMRDNDAQPSWALFDLSLDYERVGRITNMRYDHGARSLHVALNAGLGLDSVLAKFGYDWRLADQLGRQLIPLF